MHLFTPRPSLFPLPGCINWRCATPLPWRFSAHPDASSIPDCLLRAGLRTSGKPAADNGTRIAYRLTGRDKELVRLKVARNEESTTCATDGTARNVKDSGAKGAASGPSGAKKDLDTLISIYIDLIGSELVRARKTRRYSCTFFARFPLLAFWGWRYWEPAS